jgi:hypothetical protein
VSGKHVVAGAYSARPERGFIHVPTSKASGAWGTDRGRSERVRCTCNVTRYDMGCTVLCRGTCDSRKGVRCDCDLLLHVVSFSEIVQQPQYKSILSRGHTTVRQLPDVSIEF